MQKVRWAVKFALGITNLYIGIVFFGKYYCCHIDCAGCRCDFGSNRILSGMVGMNEAATGPAGDKGVKA